MQGTPRDRTRSRPQVAGSGFRDAGVPCHQVYVEVAGRLTEWGADLSAYPDRGLATSARAPPPPRDALVYQRGYWPFPSCICCGVFFFGRGMPPPLNGSKGRERGLVQRTPTPEAHQPFLLDLRGCADAFADELADPLLLETPPPAPLTPPVASPVARCPSSPRIRRN